MEGTGVNAPNEKFYMILPPTDLFKNNTSSFLITKLIDTLKQCKDLTHFLLYMF